MRLQTPSTFGPSLTATTTISSSPSSSPSSPSPPPPSSSPARLKRRRSGDENFIRKRLTRGAARISACASELELEPEPTSCRGNPGTTDIGALCQFQPQAENNSKHKTKTKTKTKTETKTEAKTKQISRRPHQREAEERLRQQKQEQEQKQRLQKAKHSPRVTLPKTQNTKSSPASKRKGASSSSPSATLPSAPALSLLEGSQSNRNPRATNTRAATPSASSRKTRFGEKQDMPESETITVQQTAIRLRRSQKEELKVNTPQSTPRTTPSVPTSAMLSIIGGTPMVRAPSSLQYRAPTMSTTGNQSDEDEGVAMEWSSSRSHSHTETHKKRRRKTLDAKKVEGEGEGEGEEYEGEKRSAEEDDEDRSNGRYIQDDDEEEGEEEEAEDEEQIGDESFVVNEERLMKQDHWSRGQLDLFALLRRRGRYPVFPAGWALDFLSLPDKIFVPPGEKGVIYAHNPKREGRAILAFDQLIQLGGRIRDKIESGLPVEPLIKKRILRYISWAEKDGGISSSQLGVFVLAESDDYEACERRMKMMMAELAEKHREARETVMFRKEDDRRKRISSPDSKNGDDEDGDSDNDEDDDTKCPAANIYGVAIVGSVVALVSLNTGHLEAPTRTLLVVDYKGVDMDVWNSIAIALLVIQGRNEQIARRDWLLRKEAEQMMVKVEDGTTVTRISSSLRFDESSDLITPLTERTYLQDKERLDRDVGALAGSAPPQSREPAVNDGGAKETVKKSRWANMLPDWL